MVNNSAKIGTMLSFGQNDFYFIEIIKRRKDNPDMTRSENVIKNFYVDSLNDFIKLIPVLIKICDYENARAYIRINKRNYKELGMHVNKRIVEYIISGNEKSIRNAFDSVAGEKHSDPDKKWIVDVDDVTVDYICQSDTVNKLIDKLIDLQTEAKRRPLTEILPTKNGIHIITRPFNLKKFKDLYPKIDVHKDNLIMIYCP